MPDTDSTTKPTCFIAMPVTTREREVAIYKDDLHWEHVMNALFVKAVEAAGYEPVIPIAKGSHLIHEVIVQRLEQTDLVLCDLSADNPNVLFELGVRTSLNKPIALVTDGLTPLPFDTSGINTHTYKSALNGWDMDDQIASLAAHIRDAAESCGTENPLWRKFGLTLRASAPTADESPTDARIDLLLNELPGLRERVEMLEDENNMLRHAAVSRSPSTRGNSGEASDAEHCGFLVSQFLRREGFTPDVRMSSSNRTVTVALRSGDAITAEQSIQIDAFAVRCGVAVIVEDRASDSPLAVFEGRGGRYGWSDRGDAPGRDG